MKQPIELGWLVASMLLAAPAARADDQSAPAGQAQTAQPGAPASAPSPATEAAPDAAGGNAGGYGALIQRAVAEFDNAHYAEARALFERAHAKNPSARTLRGLGVTAFELRRYTQATRELTAALSDERNPLTPELRAEVFSALARAREFVGTVELRVQPQTARVLVDGKELQAREVSLDVGDYALVVTAEGYRDATIKLTVTGGGKQTISLRLTSERLPGSAAQRVDDALTHGSDTSAASPGLLERPWFWVAVGAVVAGGVVSGIVLANDANDAKARPEPGDVSGVVEVLRVGR